MRQIKKISFALCTVFFALFFLHSAQAKNLDYPKNKVRVIVPFPGGGATDILGRLYAKALTEELGKTFWVENKPGASGTIGINLIAKAKPDGYNLVITIPSIIQTPWLFKDLPYDVLEDLEPVAQVVLANTIFIVKDDLPVNSLDEFVQLAKQKPGEISVGSYGMGSGSHIFIEQLNLKKDLDLLHVPYKGVGPLVNAILGKEVDAAFADPGSLSAYLDSGKFKILAATGTERFDILPQIKTFGEHGMDGFDLDGLIGFFAPKGTPDEILDLLNEAINKAQNNPEIIEYVESLGYIPVSTNRKEFKEYFEESYYRYGEIIKKADIKIQ